MLYKFTQLALLLAKRRVAITWMGTRAPSVTKWLADVVEWRVAEKVRRQNCSKDHKLQEDLDSWDGILNKFCFYNSSNSNLVHNDPDTVNIDTVE